MLLVAFVAAGCGPFRSNPRNHPLVSNDAASLAVMDFSVPIALDPVADGWHHRTFSGVEPMAITHVEKDGRSAIRLATSNSASMLFRFVDIPIEDYPWLRWEWFIEQGIRAEKDERTPSGDDHPARLYLKFVDSEGGDHAMEIIWGNQRLEAGEWLHLGFLLGLIEFPHFVANGGDENEGRWQIEEVDLRKIYRELWGDPSGARLVEVALFSDTDQTGAASIAYFSEIRVERSPGAVPEP